MKYEFWRHTTSGEVFAVEIDGEAVVGVCGPLHHAEVHTVDLPDYEYSAEDVDWLTEQPTALYETKD